MQGLVQRLSCLLCQCGTEGHHAKGIVELCLAVENFPPEVLVIGLHEARLRVSIDVYAHVSGRAFGSQEAGRGGRDEVP